VRHLLVTNDFPPKIGGIQTYLWELWRRLPPESFSVLTIELPGAAEFDAAQPFRIERLPVPMLLPTPSLTRRIRRLANETGSSLVVLDPLLPVGLLGPYLGLPYAVILHGAEVSVPGRLPGTRQAMARVLRGAELVVTGGRWTEAEARWLASPALLPHLSRLLPGPHQGPRPHRQPVPPVPPFVDITPGVDHHRFRPLTPDESKKARVAHALPPEGRLVLSVGRLVPRKGMVTLVRAAARLAPSRPDLTIAIAGTGRQQGQLQELVAATGAPVRLLGRVEDARLPSLYGAADVFVLACRTRWAGLEQEGFGIVFLEAAACGVPSVAGRSGGAPEAVLHERTGLVVDNPGDSAAVASNLARLLDDETERARLGRQARARVERCFAYDLLAARLAQVLEAGIPRYAAERFAHRRME
jgi:phosphatidylinositol alpha-1,6-mannosyltransferase